MLVTCLDMLGWPAIELHAGQSGKLELDCGGLRRELLLEKLLKPLAWAAGRIAARLRRGKRSIRLRNGGRMERATRTVFGELPIWRRHESHHLFTIAEANA